MNKKHNSVLTSALLTEFLMYFFVFILASLLLTEVGNNWGGWSIILAIVYINAVVFFKKVIDPIQGKIMCTVFIFLIGLVFFPKIRNADILGIKNAWIGIATFGYILLLGTGFYIKNLWIRFFFRVLCLIPLFLIIYVFYVIALSIGPAFH